MPIRKVSWAKFKNFVDTRESEVQYIENAGDYELFSWDGPYSVECLVRRDGGAEVIDFENNYKSSGNKSPAFKLKGDSDNTRIGNIKDRLKVTSASSGSLEYDDMNASTGGVARETLIGTTYTTIYSYSGAGSLIAFAARLEKADTENWQVRVLADGVSSIEAFTADFKDVYKLEDDVTVRVLGIGMSGESFRFSAPGDQKIIFNSSIQIQARRVSGSKKFLGGIAGVVKE